MIKSSWNDKEGLIMEGPISQVSAECVMIMRQIYKRNKEKMGKEVALGILTNMLLKAIDEDDTAKKIEWRIVEDE